MFGVQVAALPFFFTVAICIVLPFPLIHSITLDVHHRDDARDCYLLANSELAFSVGGMYIYAITMALSWACMSVALAWRHQVPAPERAELGNRAVRYLAVTTVLNTIGSSGPGLTMLFLCVGASASQPLKLSVSSKLVKRLNLQLALNPQTREP